MIIPNDYFTKEKEVKLTEQEIDSIIEALERETHNLFIFLDYDKIIKKLKEGAKNE